MKKFIRKMLPFIAFILVLEIAIPMVVDPYNVFHWSKIRDNGVEPNSNYIKMEYILHNPDKFDSFLFGSSRTGFIDAESIPEGNWYNMSYSEGLPEEHYENLLTMIDNGIIPKNVMIGIDNISCFVNPLIHEEQFYRIPYPETNRLSFYANYFSIKGVIRSLEVIMNHESTDPDYVERYYRSGSGNRELIVNNNWEENDAPYWESYYTNEITSSLLDIQNIVDLCEEYDINLIIFTNPLYYKTYQESNHFGYELFLEWLAGVSDYYNFSGVNDLSQDQSYYLETSHYNMEVGDMIINRIFYDVTDEHLESQGFGFYVTPETMEEFKEALDNH